ncbi:NAC domain-containing protein 40 [Vigna radiata var. radiata]|uniref:NAC domain-containing protein 40 n=1 Tax=Vigna radiata var. radiata TaxID=3916 RepID=A0A1S3VT64_VIGRR|nr:NAC domain-containing protein 40 [Vigna radiata var. radiata]
MKIIGMGFRPSDEELVDFYLKHKLLDDDPRVHVLTDIDLSDVEPWEIPEMLAKSVIPFKDSKWFFFSPVNLKYSNSKRFKRTTKSGFWKPTGKPRDVRTGDTNTVIGTKKTLVFQSGHVSKGVSVNSNWVIHEYHALNFLQNQNAFVLCCLIKKHGKTTEGGTAALICDEEESSSSLVSDYENQAIAEGVPSGDTFTGMETICQATHQEGNCISPMEQSLIEIEKDDNAYFRNEKNIRQIPGEAMQNPCETMQTVCETMQTHGETIQIPCETMQIPCETMQIPCETMQIPCETMQIPCETMQTPCETVQTPCETMQVSWKTMQIPFETIEAPFETMQTPLDPKQFPFENTQILLELWNSLLADESLVTQSKSLKRPYCESSYIDAEVVPERDGSIDDSSTMCTEYLNLDEYHSSKRFKTSYDVVDGDTGLQFSNQEASQKQESIFQDDLWGVETSSCDSIIYNPVEFNWNEISSFPCSKIANLLETA